VEINGILDWVTPIVLVLGIGLLIINYFKLKNVRNAEEKVIIERQEIEKKKRDFISRQDKGEREYIKEDASDPDREQYQEKIPSESLIDFLRLKSEKIEISKERFNLNNVLNEVSGSLAADFPDRDIGLIFDIDKTVPRYLTGDSLHLGQVLIGLIKSSIQNGLGKEIKLEISKGKNRESEAPQELQFKIIDMSTKLPDKREALISMPYYDDETDTYVGLELFVANELVLLMRGKLSVEVLSNKGAVYVLRLPFDHSDWKERRRYRLPTKSMMGKKVLLCDENRSAALALEKMLNYFRYTVTIIPLEVFKAKKTDMSEYDIVILDEKLFAPHVDQYLKRLKKEKNIKVMGLYSIFANTKVKIISDVVDKYLAKPLSQERIYEAIIEIYKYNEEAESATLAEKEAQETKIQTEAQIHKAHFSEKPNITTKDFAKFSGMDLLIVEDNIINQKILTNVLAYSGMNLIIANNGQEAVDLVLKSEHTFDLILMDINMPIMDGYMATSLIRKDERFATLPIVALTALVLETEVNKMFDHGVSGYLSKPLIIGKLYTALAYFLEKKDNERDVSSENYPKEDVVAELALEGIDIKQGIEYADGNEALYREVLSEFLSAYGYTDSLMRDLVDEQKIEEIKILCSDMRSLTKTIGAYKMHDVSDRMYKLFLYNNHHMVPKYAEEYGRELSALRVSIETYIGG